LRAARFHEISLATSDIRASVEFYESLGFAQAPTADTWPHRYGVLTDGRLFVGLHQYAADSVLSRSLSLTFVLPDLARQVGDLEALGIELTVRRTGEEVFNEIGFADPFGHAVTLIEARTYSPVSGPPAQMSLCGYFGEISLPATDFEAARAFWEPLGFVSVGEAAEPYPHLTLTSDHLDLAFHSPSLSRSALLVFRDRDMRERIDRLRQLGFPLARELPAALSSSASALLRSPEAAALLLLEGDD
jgi:catechol 2,3-dioxygenase-like lactoylglutathione lyase family enzyme